MSNLQKRKPRNSVETSVTESLPGRVTRSSVAQSKRRAKRMRIVKTIEKAAVWFIGSAILSIFEAVILGMF